MQETFEVDIFLYIYEAIMMFYSLLRTKKKKNSEWLSFNVLRYWCERAFASRRKGKMS